MAGGLGWDAIADARAHGEHVRARGRAQALAPGSRRCGRSLGLHRWGPTLAAGYLGAAARYPDAAAIIDELGTVTFERGAIGARTRWPAASPATGSAAATASRSCAATIAGSSRPASPAPSSARTRIYLNTAFAGPQVTEVVAREDPAAIVYDQEFAAVVRDACAGRAAVRGLVRRRRPPPSTPSLEELIATRSEQPLPPPAEPGRTVILTSGTTGTPKGANRASPGSLGPAAALLSAIPLHARETTMIAAPLFHSWGFAHMFLSTALSSTLVLRRRFDPPGDAARPSPSTAPAR